MKRRPGAAPARTLAPGLVLAAAALGLVAAAAALPARAGGWVACPEGGWQTTMADAAEHALVCRGVAAGADALAACGIPVAGAGRVRLLDALPVFCDSAAHGVFDAASGEIRLGRPALCAEAAPAGSLFALLPRDEAYVALAAHEAAHALIFAGGLGAERRLEHEYIAGVVQHAVLAPEWRAALVAGLGAARPVSDAEFNPYLLAFAPGLYAAKAWLDFEARPDGCAHLQALATGAARLPDLPF